MHKVIKRRKGVSVVELKELWEYRELLGFLAWRDIAVRYKQTVVGVGWAFVRPLITMAVLTFVFGRVAKLPSDGVPYALLTFSALVPWQFFASGFGEVSNSVVGNGYMIKKIYFPRLIIPLASAGVATVDFAVSFLFLLILMVGMGVMPGARIVALPAFFLLTIAFTLGLGLWFATLFARYRDVRHFIPLIVQLGLYISPVAFTSRIVPGKWRLLYSINPMVSVIDGFRWSLFGTTQLYVPGLILGAAISVTLLVSGVLYFKHGERQFADLL